MPIIGDTQLQPVNILGQFVQGIEMGRSASAARQQEQVNALQFQQQQQALADANALRAAMSRGATDDEVLRLPGGAAFLESQFKARKERSQAGTEDLKQRAQRAEFLASQAGSWLRMPTLNKAALAPWVARMQADDMLSPEAVSAFEEMPDDPEALRAGLQQIAMAGMDIKSQLEQQFTSQDLGGSVRLLQTPKYGEGSARVVPGSVAAVTPSPNASRTSITNILPGSEKFANVLAEGAAKSLDTLRTGAQSATRSIQTIERLRPLLDDPKFISGTWANARIAIARALGQDVAATEAYFAGIAGEVAERIRAFGSGTGLSDKDREFAQQWAGGKPDLSTAGIKRILQINEASSRAVIGAYNAERDRLATDVDPAVNRYYPTIAEPPRSNGPSPGDVQNGYRFKGGNPADKANWEKVK